MYSSPERVRDSTSSHEYARISDFAEETLTNRTTYRSAMSPRTLNIPQSRHSPLAAGRGVTTRVLQSFSTTGNSGSFGPGLASLANFPGVPLRGSNASNLALVGMNQVRHREKQQLEQLNDKFAQYVEKVRFLEAQNRKLLMELEALRNRSGQGSSRIKEMYEIEMAGARQLIDDTKRDAAASTVKAQQAEQDVKRKAAQYQEISNLRDTDRKGIDSLQRQIAENEAQIALFRRRMEDLDDEGRRFKSHAQRLTAEIARLQNEIQNETFTKASCEVEKMALEDEIASLKHMHEAALAELRGQTISNDLDPSQFFRNELSQAIREIRNDYENRADSQRNEAQGRYAALYHELVVLQQRGLNPVQNEQQRVHEERIRKDITNIRNQNGYLQAQNQSIRNRIDDLQRKLQLMKAEGGSAQAKLAKDIEDAKRRLETANRTYEEVTSMKTSLEKEISTYRDLLESQNGLRGYVDRIVQGVQQQAIDQPTPSKNAATSALVMQTYISTAGSKRVASGLSSLASDNTRPSRSYQSISSGFTPTPRDSYTNDSVTRLSGEY